MADVNLTPARLRELFHYDPETGVFTRLVKTSHNAGAGSVTNGYQRLIVDGKRYAAHRLAWLYMTGDWPSAEIDHINGIGADNRFANLRDVGRATNQENLRRARSDNHSSGVLGVHWSEYHKKWKAHIRVDGRLKHLRYCDTKEEAQAVYLDAKRRLHEGCTI